MAEPILTRLWNALKPPPAAIRPGEIAHQRRQRRLITISIGTIIAIAFGAGIFNYVASSDERAQQEFQDGMKLMKPGTYPQAVKKFNRAVGINPQLVDAYFERGNAHHYLNDDAAALVDFQ